ncbi:MAG TPA: hypothetical protein VH458_09740 [Vicinamibacterales bacterium]|jgi:hypothetical protein
MASIRALCTCIGLTESDVSVLKDFFGFFAKNGLPPDPTGAPVQVSLKRQVDRLEGLHFHLNVFRIGSDLFSDSDNSEIDYSIFKLRNIYHLAAIGVGRILHKNVQSANAGGLDSPTTKGDLRQITQNWTADNDGIDLFIPNNMNVTVGKNGLILGFSPVGGTCAHKDKTTGLSGSTAGLWGTRFTSGTDQTARSIAHELGHYLGLWHKNKRPTNLMCQSGKVVPPGSIRTSTGLTEHQVKNISNHCSVESGC